MIDAHCHIDLYKNPVSVLNESETRGLLILAMTNLPSHFELGYSHTRPFKRVRLALGMHPLLAEKHSNEFAIFERNLSLTSYIGEVGLDYSREGYATKDLQIQSFTRVLNLISDKQKLVSLHSRRAERDVYNLLLQFNIKSAIFHWYSGPLALIDEISASGYFFSVNPAMCKSTSGQKIIRRIPRHRMLTETDGPYVEVNGKTITPKDVYIVCEYLSSIWLLSVEEVQTIVAANFRTAVSMM